MPHYIGMDVHKKFTHCTVLEEDGTLIASDKLINDPSLLTSYLSQYSQPRVCFEAVGNWYWLSDLLKEQNIEHSMAHPLKLKAIASAKIKNDRIDSKTIAHLFRTNFIPESYMATPDQRALRDTLRFRIQLVQTRTKLKNSVHAVLMKYNFSCPVTDVFGKRGREWLTSLELREEYQSIIQRTIKMIDELSDQIDSLEKQAGKMLEPNEENRLLQSVPGIGPLTAALLLGEIGPIERFPSAEQFASFTGLVPSIRSSAGKTKQGGITKQGNPYIRWTLVETVARLCRFDSWFNAQYVKLSKKRGTQVARVAMARKLAVIIYKILRDKREFEQRPVRRQA